ncbi:MAG: DHH family phosphoesterase [Candidatus Delongbacteria bacterium]|nr:DHH family phosphoesterase [Candidatus Delongbacteria bacterium]MBN2835156.1 DHH family phosphoesterase [Candidatus Delongbacteria bacterium]
MTFSFSDYLLRLKNRNNSSFSLITGNQSADCDSVFSSLLGGFYLSSMENLYIPVISVKYREIFWRKDLIKILNDHSIDPKLFLYIDEVNGIIEKAKGVVLVDHNAPFHPFSKYSDMITAIYDHHEMENNNSKIEIVLSNSTSCITIFYNLLKQKNLNCNFVASLTLHTMYLDSFGFSDKFKKYNDDDFVLYKLLLKSLSIKPTSLKAILDLRFDNFGLDCEALILKDYKSYNLNSAKVGSSTITNTLCRLEIDINKFNNSVQKIMSDENLNFYFGLMFARDDKRELFFAFRNTPKKELLMCLIYRFGLKVLRLGVNCILFSQKDLYISRKKMMPIVLELIDSNS